MFWDGKPLTSPKKGSWAQVGVKPLRNAGSKSKVQFLERGVILESKEKRRHVGKSVLMADIKEELHKRKQDLGFVGGGPKNYGYKRGSTI